jgi:hypothetical protein
VRGGRRRNGTIGEFRLMECSVGLHIEVILLDSGAVAEDEDVGMQVKE